MGFNVRIPPLKLADKVFRQFAPLQISPSIDGSRADYRSDRRYESEVPRETLPGDTEK